MLYSNQKAVGSVPTGTWATSETQSCYQAPTYLWDHRSSDKHRVSEVTSLSVAQSWSRGSQIADQIQGLMQDVLGINMSILGTRLFGRAQIQSSVKLVLPLNTIPVFYNMNERINEKIKN